ncbi:hypothetical protein MPSEU_000121800 [Mayamaea pseudoterrestris]|nr:hypothetical protein MPSEU_000121800 [Mayamaea pseudoterrestris]
MTRIHYCLSLLLCSLLCLPILAFRPAIQNSFHHSSGLQQHHNILSSTQLYAATSTKDLLKNMEQDFVVDEDGQLILQAIRGRGLNNDDQAVAGLRMQLVELNDNNNNQQKDLALPLVYDPVKLQAIFRQRPRAVLTRILQLATVGGGFAFELLLDKLLKRMNNNPDLEVTRAGQLRDLLTQLGPFYIKIGQALSIRPDVLSPRSMVELQQLCDKVPSFDSVIAFRTIERELGKPVSELFSEITPEPVAAASLGQVYKATLRATNDTVAVKVQRPAVLETVSLDLYLTRQVGLLARNFPTLTSRIDAVALLDEFAGRFYAELDYCLECANGIRIAQDMKVLPMVVIPKNYPEYTSRRVHVAEWIDGEKLSSSKADDVGALVNLGVITYLTQLLDSRLFHADPHPGNMMRTKDGKLAILDFGLMTEITDDQKYGMVEAIVHLINRDYSEIGQDFINLDFIPKGTDTTGIVPALTKVFDVALAGGGAKSINFQELAADLAEITFEYPFRIPPYFALVIRAISVLEGIALVGNPNFAIIDEAYPYIARRLLTDRSPRLRQALKYMIYGRDGEFDAENLIDMLQALEKFGSIRDDGDGSAFKVDGVRGSKVVGRAGDFTGSQQVDLSDRDTDIDGGRFRVSAPNGATASPDPMATSSSSTTSTTTPRNDERTVRQALQFFFGPDGNVLREFLLEEIVTVVDASSRDAVQTLIKSIGLDNLPLPSIFRALSPELTNQDRRMVQQIRKVIQFLLGDFEAAAGDNNQRMQQLIPILQEYARPLREFGLLLVARLTEKNLSRGMRWLVDSRAKTSGGAAASNVNSVAELVPVRSR